MYFAVGGGSPDEGYGDAGGQAVGAVVRDVARWTGWRGGRTGAQRRCFSGTGQIFAGRRGACRLLVFREEPRLFAQKLGGVLLATALGLTWRRERIRI